MNGLKSKAIVREHSAENTDWSGGVWQLLCDAKELTSPFGDVNTYDASTLKDTLERLEEGRTSAGDITLESPWSIEELERLLAMEGKVYDVLFLYGTDGVGGAGKLAFTATVKTTPGSATAEHLVLNTRVLPKSEPVFVNDKYTVDITYDEFGEITAIEVTKAGE